MDDEKRLELTDWIKEGMDELADELRANLQGTAYLQLADALTEKVHETVGGMPGATPKAVRNAELLTALQLINGTRSTA